MVNFQKKITTNRLIDRSFTENLFYKMWNATRFYVSSLRRGHANLLCIVPILVYVFRMEYENTRCFWNIYTRVNELNYLGKLYFWVLLKHLIMNFCLGLIMKF